MGPMGQLMGMIPGMGGMAKEAQEAVDRGELQADRGDHPVDDAARAARPGDPQRLAAAADRGRRPAPTLTDVNRLDQAVHAEMQKLMKQLSGGGGRRAALGGLHRPAVEEGPTR